MNLKELTTPIQMYWDIGPNDQIGLPDYQRIAGEISAAKFLSLQITETAPVLSGAALKVLETLAGKPLNLSLVLTKPLLDGNLLGLLTRCSLATVFLTISSLAELIAIPAMSGRTAG